MSSELARSLHGACAGMGPLWKNGGSTQRVIKIESYEKEVLPCHFCEEGGVVMAVKARFRS